jgi:glucose-6-phosphate 1-epimerase
MLILSAIEESLGIEGQPKIVLRLEDKNGCVEECEVYLFGATITSWKRAGKEMLLLSELAIFDGKKAIRGGIPLVFPQFGQPNPSMPQHGLARTMQWKFIFSQRDESSITAFLLLQGDAEMLKLWPHSFILVYEIVLAPNSLTTRLHIINPSGDAFPCQCLLHTYLKVKDIRNLIIRGFQNTCYIDKLENGAMAIDERDEVLIAQEVDRIYLRSAADPRENSTQLYYSNSELPAVPFMTVLCSAARTSEPELWESLTDLDLRDRLHYAEEDFAKGSLVPLGVDRVLWNAWIDKSRALADLQDTAYMEYVCVEPGLVSEAVVVLPGRRLTLSQTLQCS